MPSVRTPRADQELAQRARHHRQHDVVDGAPERVLDDLEVLQRTPHPREAPMGADVHVQRRRRRGVEHRPHDLPHALRRLARRGERAVGVRQRIGRARRQLHPRAQRPLRTRRQQLQGARLAVGLPRFAGVAHRRRLGREVEQHGRQVDPGDPVDQRVVGLGDQRATIVLQALDQPHLPQRLGAVELLGEDARGEVAQLLPIPRRRQRRVAHVVLEVEARIIHPHGAPAVERRVRVSQLVAVARHQVQALADLFEELLQRRRRALQQREPAHVHVRARPLLVQEGGVHRREPVEMTLRHGETLRLLRAHHSPRPHSS